MKALWFHLMPYPELPEGFREDHRSVWVDIDPSLYDPAVGHRAYHDYLDELEPSTTRSWAIAPTTTTWTSWSTRLPAGSMGSV